MKLLMLVLNTFENDNRVERTAQTLGERGLDVTLLALRRDGLPTEEFRSGFLVRRVDLKPQRPRATPPTISGAESPQSSTPTSKLNDATSGAFGGGRLSQVRRLTGLLNPDSTSESRQGTDRENRTAREIIADLRNSYPALYFAALTAHSFYWFLILSLRRAQRVGQRVLRLIGRAMLSLIGAVLAVLFMIPFVRREAAKMRSTLSGLGLGRYLKALDFHGGLRTNPELAFERRRRRYEAFADEAMRVAYDVRPDLVHAHDFTTLLAAKKIWQELGVPFVYDSHELWVERNRSTIEVCPAEIRWERETERECMHAAAFSITVCDSIADHLARMHDVKRPIVIRNTPYRSQIRGVVLGNSAETQTAPEGLRQVFKLDPNDFVAVYVGKLAENRGVTDILHALPLLDEKVKFVAMGPVDSRFKEKFDALVQDMGISSRVFFHPAVEAEDIPKMLAGCNLSLTTMNRSCLSYVYTLPNKLFESIQSGVPILGPDSPEIERIVSEYHCGLTYRDRDHQHLAERIESLVKNPELLSKLREGTVRARRELCWEEESKILLASYEEAFGLSAQLEQNQAQVAIH